MIDDAFVFDCVAHVFNFEPKNAFGQAGLMRYVRDDLTGWEVERIDPSTTP